MSIFSHGEEFGTRLRARASSFASRGFAVTKVRCDEPDYSLSDPLPPEDAFIIALQLRDYPVHEYWEDGRNTQVTSLKAGDTTLYDCKRSPIFLVNNPFESIHFCFPRASLDQIADEANAAHIDELHYTPGVGTEDRTMRSLGQALLPAFENPACASNFFVE